MQQMIQYGAYSGDIAEQLAPVLDRTVGSEVANRFGDRQNACFSRADWKITEHPEPGGVNWITRKS